MLSFVSWMSQMVSVVMLIVDMLYICWIAERCYAKKSHKVSVVMLSFVMLNINNSVVMQSVYMLNATFSTFVMLIVDMLNGECWISDHCYTEYHIRWVLNCWPLLCWKSHMVSVVLVSINMLNDTYSECCFPECHYSECC